MTAINVVGITASSRINAIFTVIEVGGLLVVIALGMTRPEFGRSALRDVDLNIFPAAALVFFAFLGFEEIANLAEEARDPPRDVPRAILIGVAVSTTLYILVALSATSLLAARGRSRLGIERPCGSPDHRCALRHSEYGTHRAGRDEPACLRDGTRRRSSPCSRKDTCQVAVPPPRDRRVKHAFDLKGIGGLGLHDHPEATELEWDRRFC